MMAKQLGQERRHQTTPTGLYVLISLLVILLGVIFSKGIHLPSWLIACGSALFIFMIFFFGINKPEIPFYILVAYLPFNKVFSGTFGGFMTAVNLTNILIFIVVFCWFVSSMSKREKLFENNGLNWLILIFSILGFFSVLRGGFFYGSRYMMEFIIPLKQWFTPVFLYYIALNLARNRDVLKNTVIIVMIVLTVAGLLAIKEGFDVGGSGSLDKSRVGGLAQQPNMMGAFFVYYMFLFLGFFFLDWKKLKSWWLLIPFFICFRGIQVTFSRGAYIAFAFGLFTITFFKSKFLFIFLIFLIVFSFLNPQFLPGGVRYAINRTEVGEKIYDSTPFEDTLDKSSASRIEIWRGAIEIIKDNPLLGIGYGIFPYVIPSYVPNVGQRDAHNTFLIIAAEMGLPSLAIFLLIIFVLSKNILWLYRNCEDKFIKGVALGMCGGIGGLLMANMFGSRLNSEEVSSYFWILAGLIVKAVIMKKRKQIN